VATAALNESLKALVVLGFKNQLANKGPFTIGVLPKNNTIDNEFMEAVGLRYLSANQSESDGGIDLTFCVLGNAGKEMLDSFKGNNFVVTFHNLELEPDMPPLDIVYINNKSDCEFVSAFFKEARNQSTSDITHIENVLDTFYQSQEIQHLNTLVHYKIPL
jgi:hypothetical protein